MLQAARTLVVVFAAFAFAGRTALAETASLVPPPGWSAQELAVRVRGGVEALGYWSGAKSENAPQTLILLKVPHAGSLEEWSKAHLADVLKNEPTVIVDEDVPASVCGKKLRAHHLRFRDTVDDNLMAIEQYAVKGADDFIYYVTYTRLERQPAVAAARQAMTGLCLHA